jgi:FkbM family methyltransferase
MDNPHFISYAQNFEDVMLWRALCAVESGYYIDIGAQDPVIDSVSLAFHEHGWHGIHVEPTAHYAGLLKQQRPGDTVLQAAVGSCPGVLPMFEIPNTGITTLDAAIAQQHRERGFDVQATTAQVLPLSEVLALAGNCDVHWMKIDVEGFERQALAGWGESAVRPWVVVIESTLPLTQILTHEEWEPILLAKGYAFAYFDGLNRFYVAEGQSQLQSAFAAPPNVFDNFALNGTASATFHLRVEARGAAAAQALHLRLSAEATRWNDDRSRHAAEAAALSLQLEKAGGELTEARQAWAVREQALLELALYAEAKLADAMGQVLEREQTLSRALQLSQDKAALERDEFQRHHQAQRSALQRRLSDREQSLIQRMDDNTQRLLAQKQAQLDCEHKLAAEMHEAQAREAALREELTQAHAQQLASIQQHLATLEAGLVAQQCSHAADRAIWQATQSAQINIRSQLQGISEAIAALQGCWNS